MAIFFSLLVNVMEVPGKYFLYSLTLHVTVHLAGFHSDSNSAPPYCGLHNHNAMEGVAVFHAFQKLRISMRSFFVRVEVNFTAR